MAEPAPVVDAQVECSFCGATTPALMMSNVLQTVFICDSCVDHLARQAYHARRLITADLSKAPKQ